MEQEHEHSMSLFSKTLMTGVFAGFTSTVLCLFFNVIYRSEVGFVPSDIINVSSLIFAVNLLFAVIGVLYFVFLKYLPKGNLLFMILFALITLFLLLETSGVHRSSDATVNHQFKGLLSGVIIIVGLFAALFMPIAFQNKDFQENVL